METLKLMIDNQEDRLTVAAILIKNGYAVSQGKQKKPSGKSYDYFLSVGTTITAGAEE